MHFLKYGPNLQNIKIEVPAYVKSKFIVKLDLKLERIKFQTMTFLSVLSYWICNFNI